MGTPLFDLSGRVALVTGSSRGLGLTIARGLGEAGARIALNGRNADTVGRAVDEMSSAGLTAVACVFDVTDPDTIRGATNSLRGELGNIDILVNCAGIQRRAPMVTMEESEWREVIDVNLTGAFLVSRSVALGMIERERGKIINICSLMSEVGRPTIANYAAAKGGLKMLTKSMAVEWGPSNIQANGIGPGYFRTEMTRPLYEDEEFDRWISSRTPAGRWGEPTELIGTAIFLASAASDFINGQIIYVDGGILSSL